MLSKTCRIFWFSLVLVGIIHSLLNCVAALLLLWQRGLAAELSRLASRCSLHVSFVLEESSTHEVAQMPVDYILHRYYVFLLLQLLDVLGWDAGRSPNTL